MKDTLKIVKLGGHILDDPDTLDQVIDQFARIEGYKILIHGGGKIASQISESLGITPHIVDGRRITDAESLKVVVMTYAGLINKTLVALLQASGCNAMGLTGADGNTIPAKKRETQNIDYGFVGDLIPDNIDSSLINLLLKNGITPVFCAVTHDQHGHLLNTNADTLASGLAIALSSCYEVQLLYCFEKPGVLNDARNDKSLIKELNFKTYQDLKNKGMVHSGMIPKLENGFYAQSSGVSVVLKHALEMNQNSGTVLTE